MTSSGAGGSGQPLRCIVTGGSSGIGRSVVEGLAARGARVVGVARRRETAEVAREEIRGAHPTADVDFVWSDLASLAEVRRLADELAGRFEALDVLIHVAGVVEPRARRTPEGHEATLAINHLAPFLLSERLQPRLRAAAPARIVTVSSQVHARAAELTDFEAMPEPYRGLEAYRRSKLANILFTREWARRVPHAEVAALCLHPGVVATGLLEAFSQAEALEAEAAAASAGAPAPTREPGVLSRGLRWVVDRIRWRLLPSGLASAEEAAARILFLATDPSLEGRSGGYYVDDALAEPAAVADDASLSAALWDWSRAACGLEEAGPARLARAHSE